VRQKDGKKAFVSSCLRGMNNSREEHMKRFFYLAAFWLIVFGSIDIQAEEPLCPEPIPRAACPVCGMFVIKYPDWVATVVYKDGDAHHFDGAKDMFKYLLDLPKYAPDHRKDMIRQMCVTDYYLLEQIDAKDARYVIGSDVTGPMGHELVPLATQGDAEEFMKDHKGKKIVGFEQVTSEMLEALDSGT